MRPPAVTGFSLRNLLPQFFRFNLRIANSRSVLRSRKIEYLLTPWSFRTACNSGQIGLCRFAYSSWLPGLSVIRKALRIIIIQQAVIRVISVNLWIPFYWGRLLRGKVSLATPNDIFRMLPHLDANLSSPAVSGAVGRVIPNDVTPIDVI